MPTINKKAVVAYTQQQMYDLVNDIDSYPEFIPWCVSSNVDSKTEDEIRATLAFSRGGLEKSFTTMNRLQPHRMVEICLVNGPFKQLEGFWRFEELENNHCRIVLDLEYEFSNRILAMMFGPLFYQIAVMLVDSFSERAKQVYKK